MNNFIYRVFHKTVLFIKHYIPRLIVICEKDLQKKKILRKKIHFLKHLVFMNREQLNKMLEKKLATVINRKVDLDKEKVEKIVKTNR